MVGAWDSDVSGVPDNVLKARSFANWHLLVSTAPVYHCQSRKKYNSPFWKVIPHRLLRQWFYNLCSLEQFIGAEGEDWI